MISIKNKLYIVVFIFLLSFLYSYPNFYGESPSIIFGVDESKKSNFLNVVKDKFLSENLNFYSIDTDTNIGLIVRFKSTEDQFNAYECLKKHGFSNLSLNILESKKVVFLKSFGIKPMKIGLDLRGGIYLLVKVNIDNNLNNHLKLDVFNFVKFLNLNKENYKKLTIKNNNIVIIKFSSNISRNVIILNYIKLHFNLIKVGDDFIILSINKKKFFEIRKQVIEQTIFIFNKRINELGISDSLVRSRGKNNIIIEIAGIQDIARAKKILGKTATLKFMLVDVDKREKSHKVFYEEKNKYIFLKNDILLTGDAIVHASASFEHTLNKPCINIKISKKDIKNFESVTRNNVGNLMAIVYKESILTSGEEIIKEYVISVATIMSSLGHEFQITGLNIQESKDLALLLRSGSLPASVFIVEEKLIGPTIGEDNIKKGILSILVSFFLIFFFMLCVYNRLGLVANLSLIINIFMIFAIMSFIELTLTLPGLAGIAITIAMSIDGNILIFERIKEEFAKKKDLYYCIEYGFRGAFSSIVDSNLTTLIVGLVLFILGDGPVKGFAITLSIGVLTSMFSSIFITKSFIDFLSINRIRLL
ncbi:MAG TPA: protein translocase subunit SecD [Candidatus Azoamicus sp. MARI]